MNLLARRIPSVAALAAGLLFAQSALATVPTSVAITAPAAGALGVLSSPGNSVTISATATPSAGGAISQVDFRVNGVSVGVATTAPYSVNWTPAAPGTYNLSAIATDNTASPNTLTSAAVTVTVSALRTVSVSAPATNAVIAQNSQVPVRATAVMSDGVVGSVSFTFNGAAIGAPITTAPYFLNHTFTDAPGTYNLVATATASDGITTWSSTATYPITIAAQQGAAPTVAFVAPLVTDVIAVGNAVTVTATASDTDGFIPSTAPGGVSFYADGELIGTDLTAPYSVTWTPNVAKTVTLLATATDDKGNSRSDSRSVTVLSVAPTVSITSPSNNSSATAGTAVTVNANATAGTGTTVTSVQFLADGVPIATDNSAPYSVSWTPAASGTVALTARVTDSNGTIVTSSTVTVNVAAAAGALTASLTAPANGASVPLGTTSTLTATATAAGSATVTRVDFLAGSTVVGTALTAPYSVSWTPSASGVVALTARATDSTGATATSATVNVNVTAPSVALTAPASGSAVTVGSTVALTASATAVAPAGVSRVEFLAGTTLVGTALVAPYTVNWVPTATGAVSLTARVIDSNNATVTSAAVGVTVASSVPTVSLTAPANGATLALGASATLTATASASGGASVSRVDFLAGSTVVATALTAPYTTTWVPTTAGITALTARVTDSNGTSVTSTAVNVTVTGPTVALTLPAPAAVVTTNSAVTLTASASAIAPALVSRVDFFAGTTLVGSAASAPYTITWTATPAGSVALTARVVDSNGITATSTAVNVTVTSFPPTVALTSPNAGDTLPMGAAATLTATASATGGATVARVDFLAGTTVVGTALTAPYTVAWTPTTAGITALTARVTDSNGTAVTSAAINVNVVGPTVALTAPTNGAIVGVNSPVALSATASAVAPAIVSRVDFFAGTTLVGSAAIAPYTATWTPSSAGTFSLTARVVDSNNTTVTSTGVSVTVSAFPPTVSITSPTAGDNIALGSTTTLTATASAAAGATVTRVDFLAGTTVVGTSLTAPYSVAWTPTAAGITSLTARVTDSNGTVVTTTAINVNVVGPTVVLTAPTNASVVGVNSSVTLTAVPTAFGAATVSRVDFFAGSTLIGSANSAPYSITWVASPAGTVSLTARVVDSNGVSVTSSAVSVTVAASVPTVALTAPTNGTNLGLAAPATLTATASASGGLAVARVDFLAGSTIVGTALAAPYTVTWTPTTAGIVALTARVTDTAGTVVNSPVVNVNITAPTVAITSPAPGTAASFATPLTISATAAAVAPATVSKVDFYVGSTFIGSANTAPYAVTWTPASTGTQSLTARVTDSNGAVVTSTAVSVIVATVAPTVSLTSPTTGTALAVGTPVTLTAAATAGGGATVTRVDFLAGSTIVGTALVPANGIYTFTWTPTSAAPTLTLAARVTDSNNSVDTSNSVTVSVSSATVLGVNLTVSGGSATIPIGASRYLTASVSGLTAIAQVEFYMDGQLIGTDSGAPFNILFTAPASAGAHTLTARAVDGSNGVATSPNVPIVITGAVGTPPAVGILTPIAGSFVAVNTTVAVTGTVTDPDANISSVQVFANGVSVGNATISGSNWSLNWFPTTLGTVSLTAIATDATGNAVTTPGVGVTVSDSFSPSVSLSLSPRTASAGASTTLPSGAVRNLVADATASSGRAVVRVEFFVDGTKVGEDTTVPYTYRYTAPALADGEQTHAYVLSARATDNAGAARDAQLSVLVVSPVGSPPNVSLLTPANNTNTVPGTAVTLAATATSLFSTVSSVQFYVNGSPASVNGGNGLTSAPYTTSFTPTTPGRYVIDAIATDINGNTAVSNSATVTAAFTVPTIAITAPNPNATARATPNVPLTLTATATVQVGAGASVLLVEFLLDGVQIAARTTPTNAALGTYSTTWIPTTAQLGNHQLTARVTDTNSQTTTSNPVNVLVANAVGTPPTVTISTTPIPGTGLQTLSQVNFLANAFANGVNTTITNVEFFLNDVSIGLASREQATNLYRLAYDFSRIDFASAPVNPNNPSQYILPLYAIARDSNNNQTVSAISNLTINAATSAVPTISLAALTPTTVTQGTQLFLLPTFSDSDGNVTIIQLYANGVNVQSLGSPISGQSIFTYNATTPGRYNLFAVATDDTGNTAIASPAIVVQVNAVNAPETTLTRPATASTATTVNAPVFLEGTARATGTTAVPTLAFIATGSSGSRTQINGTRIGTTTTYRAIWTPTTADTYTLVTQATVAGVQNTSSVSRTVVVNELNGLAPTVSISVPGSVTTASTFNFTATAADSDGSVVGVEFFVNRNSVGQAVRDQLANTWRLTANATGLTPGSVEVVALATDSAGNVAASGTSFMSVVAASSIAPLIDVLPSTTSAAFSRQVQLRANARDNDGTVASVQYFANGTSLGTSTNAGTSYQVNWTPTASGTFNLYAIATDNTNNTTLSTPIQIIVRRNNPILEDAAFILQTYQDIANTTSINPLLFDDLDARLAAGSMTRADLVANLVADTGFTAPVNLLALYYVLMGQWPTPQNYTPLLATARGSLTNAAGSIIASNEFLLKYGLTSTLSTALLNNPVGAMPAQTFLDRLWSNAGARPAVNRELDLIRFQNNNTAYLTPTPPYGRGYNSAGLSTALAEFVTFTNANNTALFKRARAAAIFYQLARPSVAITVEDITAKVDALATLPDDKSIADAVLKDTLYTYRYVTITKHPESLTVAPRSGALFSVEATGAPPLTYQWLLNGSPIPGATNPLLSLTNVNAGNAGTYTVAITSSVATATSDAATLTLSSVPTRLANISTRGVTSAGSNVLIGGFIVTGTAAQTRQMLIRVIGPTLGGAPFNVANALPNPTLELYAGNNRNPVLTNDDWGTQAAGPAQVAAIQQAATRAGAFALPGNSRDAAILATLPPGPYTVQAVVPAATPNATGVVLIEVYDVTQGGPAGPKAANVSTRGFVGTGASQLIAGFVVNGEVSRRMLIRGAGPTLASFGVPGVLADPQLTLVAQSTGRVIRSNDNWASGADAAIIATAASTAGAFPFASNSRDAAMLVMLPPGAYTVQLSGVSNSTGVGIVEVYDVDP